MTRLKMCFGVCFHGSRCRGLAPRLVIYALQGGIFFTIYRLAQAVLPTAPEGAAGGSAQRGAPRGARAPRSAPREANKGGCAATTATTASRPVERALMDAKAEAEPAAGSLYRARDFAPPAAADRTRDAACMERLGTLR